MTSNNGIFRLQMLKQFDPSEHYTPRSLRRYERAKRYTGLHYIFGQHSGQTRGSHGGEISLFFGTFLISDPHIFNLSSSSDVYFIDAGCGRGIFLSHFAMTHPEATVIGLEIDKFRCELAEHVMWSTSLSHLNWHILNRSFIPSESTSYVNDIYKMALEDKNKRSLLFLNNYNGAFADISRQYPLSIQGKFADEINSSDYFMEGSIIISLWPLSLDSKKWKHQSYAISLPSDEFSWFSNTNHVVHIEKYTKIKSSIISQHCSVRNSVTVIEW